MTDAPLTDHRGLVFRLMYRSHSLIPAEDRKAEHGAIFSVARPANKKVGITGALMIYDDWFAQVLEGGESDIRDLYERIRRDPRHEDVFLVDTAFFEARIFGRWSMAKVSEDEGPDIPLIMNIDRGGAVAAAGHPTTDEQDAVLDRMRDLIREGGRL